MQSKSFRPSRSPRRSSRRLAVAAFVAAALAIAPLGAAADPYEPNEAGHPVRIAAYILHPVGYVINALIMRPAHWIVSREGLRDFFGHES